MKMTGIPFQLADWNTIERTEHKGEVGVAYWQTRQYGSIRVRMVKLMPGISYQVADGFDPHRSKTTCGAKLFIVD